MIGSRYPIYRPHSTGPSGTTTLAYDANFHRVTKTAPVGTTVYIGKLFEKYTTSTYERYHQYLYAGNNLIGLRQSYSNGASGTRYFHTDHLGSVEVITNDQGAVAQRLSYDAFGKRRNVNGTDTTARKPGSENNFR